MSESTAAGARRRQRSREAAEERGAWSPRWFWPSFASPATFYLLVFFVFPFYVVLAVTFGTTDAILRQPVPFWNPLNWKPAILNFTFSNLTHADGLYRARSSTRSCSWGSPPSCAC